VFDINGFVAAMSAYFEKIVEKYAGLGEGGRAGPVCLRFTSMGGGYIGRRLSKPSWTVIRVGLSAESRNGLRR